MWISGMEDAIRLSERTRVIIGVFDLLTDELASCLRQLSDLIRLNDDWDAQITYFDGV